MFDSLGKSSSSPNDSSSLELLTELEQNTPDAVKQMRAHTRLAIRAKVIIQPGNASERLKMKIQGMTGDISSGGTQVLSPLPIRVGDIYQLTFDQSVLPVSPQFARCMRCRLVREDAFESGFSFFSQVDIPRTAGVGSSDASLV